MSTLASQPRNIDVPPPMLMKRFTVEEYHQMIQAGVFAHDDRFELLEGWIVPKMPRNRPHDGSIDLTSDEVRKRLPVGWRVRVQLAITTADSETEPDIAVVRGDARTYVARHPSSDDIALLIEVADSTLADDRLIKYRLYARALIREYWIVNLVNRQIEVFTNPTGPSGKPAYQTHQVFKDGDEVPLVIDGQVLQPLPVKDLLP